MLGDSSNNLNEAERRLQEFQREESEGFRVSANSNANAKQKSGFKVNIQGMNRQESLDDDDFDEEIIEEDIQTDRDEQANLMN